MQLQHRALSWVKVFQWEGSRWFNKKAFDQAHAFYERYGGITIVLARFMPFIRTFAPFRGRGGGRRAASSPFNVAGALIWVLGIATAGYFRQPAPGCASTLEKDHLGPDHGAGADRHLWCPGAPGASSRRRSFTR